MYVTRRLVGSLVETHVFSRSFCLAQGLSSSKSTYLLNVRSVNIFVCFMVSTLVGEVHGIMDNTEALTSKTSEPTSPVLERQEK